MYSIAACFIFDLFIIAELALLGLHDFKKGEGAQDKDFIMNNKATVLNFFVLFCFLWLLNKIDDTNKYICMVSGASYYFDCKEGKDGQASVCMGFKFAYFKNMGSICLGSLIITIVKILRAIVDSLAN